MEIEKKSTKSGKSLSEFISHLQMEKNSSPHTVSAYFSNIVEFAVKVRQADAEFDMWESVDHEQARSFVEKLYESGNSKRSIQRKLSALRSFFKFLLRQQVVKGNPFAQITPPKQERPLPLVMSVDTVDKLVEAVRTYWQTAEANATAASPEAAAFASDRKSVV